MKELDLELIKNILIISPAYPSAINGLGDYAYALGSTLSKEKKINILYAGLAQEKLIIFDNYIEINAKNSLNEIVEKHDIHLMILNYSNYGYQKKGIPFWLYTSIKEITHVPILTFFHEIYASGKIWQSSFYLKPIQVYLFKKIYKISSTVFCSNNVVLNLIKSNTKDKGAKTRNIGVFSNVPESNRIISWGDRKAQAIVFGTIGRRKNIYQDFIFLNSFILRNKISMIYDIGEDSTDIDTSNIIIPIIKCGTLNLVEISEILRESQWGFIDYPNNLLGKSGIFASYCAYGLAVLNTSKEISYTTDNLKLDNNFVSKFSHTSTIKGAILSQNNMEWYVSRNLNNHSKQILETINKYLPENE